MDTTTPITGEIEARLREILCDEWNNRIGPGMDRDDEIRAAFEAALAAMRRIGDGVLRDAAGAYMRIADDPYSKADERLSAHRALERALDRASGDGVRCRNPNRGLAHCTLRQIGESGYYSCQTLGCPSMPRAQSETAALSAVSIPRGEVE